MPRGSAWSRLRQEWRAVLVEEMLGGLDNGERSDSSRDGLMAWRWWMVDGGGGDLRSRINCEAMRSEASESRRER